MDINFGAVLAATVVMFAVGGFWYMVLFDKMWGEMFGFDKLSKAEQKEAQSKMGPAMAVQLFVTLLSAFVLTGLAGEMPNVSLYRISFMIWLGFIVPAVVSGVLFGGTDPKWFVRKIGIEASESLVRLMVASWIITLIVN